ncbi:MAG: methylated-DNA--[protein]-cysteine S-methyltransferase [Candidatus Brocadiia bacterium]
MFTSFYQSQYGPMRLRGTRSGVISLELLKDTEREIASAKSTDHAHTAPLKKVRRFLDSYFAGCPVKIPLKWLVPQPLNTFDTLVLRKLQGLPFGELTTYSKLAVRCGYPRAGRAVGNALAKNRLPVLIPCHRVIRSDSKIGGFRAGARWKEKLLRHEGHIVEKRNVASNLVSLLRTQDK